MKLINKRIIFMLLALSFMLSCQDSFLDRPSQSGTSTDNFYQTKEDLRLATAALYGGKPWWQYNQSYLELGDILSGDLIAQWWAEAVQLNTFTVSGSNGILSSAWTGLYNTVGHSNATINAILEKTPASVSDVDKNAALGEAKFIRAVSYYHLAMLWQDVPIIEDNRKLVTSPLVNRNTVEDVYKFIVSDLTFASEHLPTSDTPGRVTTWSAQGMLAKVYLTMAGLGHADGSRDQALLDKAKLYAQNVCTKSGLTLLPNYDNLFKTQYNDNVESLFALQWTATSGWGIGNQLLTHSPSDALNPGKTGAWTPYPPTYDLFELYVEKDSVRRKATFMLPGDHYAELNRAEGGYTASGSSMKKHIIGNELDNNTPSMTFLGSIEHNYILRLADVYLIYAEAILGNSASTADADALFYFNKVRTRAGVDVVTSLNTDVILKERRIELACEGQFWYDLVRLSYYNPTKAISMLSNQKRVLFDYDKVTKVATPKDPFAAISPATESTFKLGLPSSEIIANPKLAQPPVPYY
ncbi:MAG: RagB/SusD family nutrient uptake outer membrane protein [Flavobacterium sp.]|uniref:RagB/SusD family nutrient uptake outer membrane protein n=1 Tax=Flavobacterium sp. TaxID=239 RepID=UPI00260B7A1B|nr:RagB/SusD family nutrient uptake outer membrane protein [Flavobacterium sp.]MDD5149815.1 RagB/SusD family nutrient uptake outer membrane protein [Flavobacterium sp.]